MDVNEQAIAVGSRDRLGRDDECLDPGDRLRLDGDAEFLLHRRQVGDRQRGAAVDQLLPLRRAFRVGVHMRRIGAGDQRLELRADLVGRQRDDMGGQRARAGLAVGRGLRGDDLVEAGLRLRCGVARRRQRDGKDKRQHGKARMRHGGLLRWRALPPYLPSIRPRRENARSCCDGRYTLMNGVPIFYENRYWDVAPCPQC